MAEKFYVKSDADEAFHDYMAKREIDLAEPTPANHKAHRLAWRKVCRIEKAITRTQPMAQRRAERAAMAGDVQ